MSDYPVTMVAPDGLEVSVGTPVEANNLACRGYQLKIESKATATSAVVADPVEEPAPESDRKPVVKPARPGVK
ncbi:hypothetical protein OG563_26425 [Nocardia vinacea]|uniref:Uncharacterized protein n=1 Tax=Nocardia vinacea TaxID=96468 RepID=A0ABZ1YIC2_9NOCA|nr:hypothetical protein [Nocardia vinacea]